MQGLETLEARGFVQQCTDLERVREALSEAPVTYYAGFDPTAPSLHVGHLLPIMAMAWLQRAGHRAIAIVGGATAMVGDPSGKTELRRMLSDEEVQHNARAIQRQLERFLQLDGDRGLVVNNADYLLELRYIPFLRDIGRHFSVNRMLSMEAYKLRLERGLSFVEFNYQLLQSYDFLELYRRYGCTLQLGGDDQWGNIVAGVDLVRRVEQGEVHGLTTPLITTATGEKMGKTAAGAVWLDPALTPPFDFHQYWLNVDDRDVGRFLRLYTFLPLDRVEALEALEGADIREAKRVLAREVTALVHGVEAADRAEAAAAAMVAGAAAEDLPTHRIEGPEGAKLVVALADSGLCKSRGDARRLVAGGGVRVNGAKIEDVDYVLDEADLGTEGAVLRVGKRRAVRVIR